MLYRGIAAMPCHTIREFLVRLLRQKSSVLVQQTYPDRDAPIETVVCGFLLLSVIGEAQEALNAARESFKSGYMRDTLGF